MITYLSALSNLSFASSSSAAMGSFHNPMTPARSGQSTASPVPPDAAASGQSAASPVPPDAAGIPGRSRIPDPEGQARIPGKPDTDTYECQTCKNRKYKDGSDEMVSFKTPQHVSPENAASAVRAHEQEHVSNAYKKAATDNGKVISASVSIHMAVCPECGRTYVSGGTTHTQIKYYNEENPYQQDLKSADRAKYAGMNLDYAI